MKNISGHFKTVIHISLISRHQGTRLFSPTRSIANTLWHWLKLERAFVRWMKGLTISYDDGIQTIRCKFILRRWNVLNYLCHAVFVKINIRPIQPSTSSGGQVSLTTTTTTTTTRPINFIPCRAHTDSTPPFEKLEHSHPKIKRVSRVWHLNASREEASVLKFWRIWCHPFITFTPRFTLTRSGCTY